MVALSAIFPVSDAQRILYIGITAVATGKARRLEYLSLAAMLWVVTHLTRDIRWKPRRGGVINEKPAFMTL